MLLRLSFFLLIIFQTLVSKAQPCREVVAYYPSWKWYARQYLVNPATIDYGKYTIINYAFFKPNPDGSISPFDPLADKTLLLGEITSQAPPGYAKSKEFDPRWHLPGTSLVERAHRQGVKVMISIGGWTLSEHFSGIAASAEKRRRFARDCNAMIRLFNVDGIDMDWEYPGYAAQKGGPADKQNFTLLLREIRDSLDALQIERGQRFLLTSAFGVAPSRMADIEWDRVAPLLDLVNLMTYDFYGSNFSMTNHHAPLFSPAQGITGFDLHSVVRHLVERYGVPPSKIAAGLAFYGRSLTTQGAAGLHVSSKRMPDSVTFPEDKGAPMFYNIVSRLSQFNYHWDSLAQAPYLQGKKLKTFVSFEDERSVAQKARYIVDHQLAGAIVWDLTGDYVESRSRKGTVESTPLAAALADALCGKEAPLHRWEEVETFATLPQRWAFVERKTFAPRITHGLEVLKKDKKQKRKEKREQRKKKKQKRKNSVPGKYFDGGH
jgi:chitinase